MKLLSLVFAAPALGYHLNNLTTYANCRAEPTTTSAVVKQYKTGDEFDITCQVGGQRVFDYGIWDKTSDNCYLTDYYVDTPVSGNYFTKNCNYQGDVPGPVVDDYRLKGQCDGVDPYNYYNCECVSFVAQRINERMGIYFHNRYKGNHWGDAYQWIEAAHNSSVKVDTTPKKGSIAQHHRSKLGHVAWVKQVFYQQKRVMIEQYNVIPKNYSKEIVPWDHFDYYIHLTDKY
ncbi:hypothetical protein DL89DRAFT_160354 [Linderina pennispora]|uniref:Peptidase C51 domain-containing protein n=1 Tax=Linderina pennispora TaxID=61395 RepID=A0A1Y1W7G8_9FUNG|nr:uncharacterized protein DL89DRAFT_160354 [Linderina pennispora]ORX69382.1 hypothetical protein DL89DRAFT_160354 [Linderina pennispora]